MVPDADVGLPRAGSPCFAVYHLRSFWPSWAPRPPQTPLGPQYPQVPRAVVVRPLRSRLIAYLYARALPQPRCLRVRVILPPFPQVTYTCARWSPCGTGDCLCSLPHGNSRPAACPRHTSGSSRPGQLASHTGNLTLSTPDGEAMSCATNRTFRCPRRTPLSSSAPSGGLPRTSWSARTSGFRSSGVM